MSLGPKVDEDVLPRLIDLHKQATEDRSHFYVGACIRAAISEIVELRTRLSLAEQANSLLIRKLG